MYGSISDWSALFKEAFRVCKPGGWVESYEASPRMESDDGTVTETSAINEWGKFFIEGGKKLNRTFEIIDKDLQQKGMEEAGFVDVKVWDFKVRSINFIVLVTDLDQFRHLSEAGLRTLDLSRLDTLLRLRLNRTTRAMFSIWPIWFWAGLRRKFLCTALNCDVRFGLESFILSTASGLCMQGNLNRYHVADWERFHFHKGHVGGSIQNLMVALRVAAADILLFTNRSDLLCQSLCVVLILSRELNMAI